MAGRSDVEAGRAFVRLTLKIDMTKALTGALRAAGERVQGFGSTVQRIGAPIAAAGAAITGAFSAAVYHFAAVGDQLDKMSARTGISASALAEFGFAAEQSGTSMEAVEKAIRRMQAGTLDLEQGLSTAKDTYKALGLSMADMAG